MIQQLWMCPMCKTEERSIFGWDLPCREDLEPHPRVGPEVNCSDAPASVVKLDAARDRGSATNWSALA